MNPPWSLRLAVAWAALRRSFVTIRATPHGNYVVELQKQSVRAWLARRARLNERLKAERIFERERVVALVRQAAGDSIGANVMLDANTAINRIWDQLEELSPLK